LNKELSIETLQQPALEAYINQLADGRFEVLVALLYRLDISEKKVKQALAQMPEQNIGSILAPLIIERQQQKEASRKECKPFNHIPLNEQW
jgi:hypothetical protein